MSLGVLTAVQGFRATASSASTLWSLPPLSREADPLHAALASLVIDYYSRTRKLSLPSFAFRHRSKCISNRTAGILLNKRHSILITRHNLVLISCVRRTDPAYGRRMVVRLMGCTSLETVLSSLTPNARKSNTTTEATSSNPRSSGFCTQTQATNSMNGSMTIMYAPSRFSPCFLSPLLLEGHLFGQLPSQPFSNVLQRIFHTSNSSFAR
jgi:hypothetical protein